MQEQITAFSGNLTPEMIHVEPSGLTQTAETTTPGTDPQFDLVPLSYISHPNPVNPLDTTKYSMDQYGNAQFLGDCDTELTSVASQTSEVIGIAIEDICIGSTVTRDGRGLISQSKIQDPITPEELEELTGTKSTENGTVGSIYIRMRLGKTLYEIRGKVEGKWLTLGLVTHPITKVTSYYINNKKVSCQTMANNIYSMLPALECLPLSILDGPFKELDELLRRDRSISDDRFEDLEIDDEQDDSNRTSDKVTPEHQEG